MTIDTLVNSHLRKVPLYVPGKSTEELKRELSVEEIVKLGSNENPLGPSPKAIKAVEAGALDMNRYPGVEVRDLRCKLADSLGPEFDADNVIVGNGSADVILSAAQAFLFEGGEVIISRPAFQMYELATNMYGGQSVFVEPRDYGYDLEAMTDEITDQTRIIFITNPNNPTGLIVGQQDVDDLLHRVPPSVLVVFDEAYCEYADAEAYPDTLRYVREGRNVLITRTFSKIYALAGMRVGYGIARQEIIAHLLRTQPPFHSSRLSLIAAMASLADQAHVEKSRKVNAEGKEYLYRSFEKMGLHYLLSQANYVLLTDLRHDVEVINQALLQRGVIIRPSAPFGMPQAIRITVGTREENERLVEALSLTLTDM